MIVKCLQVDPNRCHQHVKNDLFFSQSARHQDKRDFTAEELVALRFLFLFKSIAEYLLCSLSH